MIAPLIGNQDKVQGSSNSESRLDNKTKKMIVEVEIKPLKHKKSKEVVVSSKVKGMNILNFY
jgi:hypothetical protein